MKNCITILVTIFFFTITTHAQTRFWGMTAAGGINDAGVIFKIKNDGSGFENVYSFDPSNGYNPNGNLILAKNGLFYGTVYNGGTQDVGGIFSYNPITNIYSFLVDFSWVNGALSKGSLIQASNDKLYGTTVYGGDTANSPSGGYGVLFSYDISTNSYSDLYHFQESTGANPNRETLLEGQNGKLFGLTMNGGAHHFGVIFSYDTTTHTYLDLHDFDSINGSFPFGGLTQATNGKYYGLTGKGGTNNKGTLFSFDPSTNDFTYLYSFFNIFNGWSPRSSLVQAGNGKLYGMTAGGGSYYSGAIFSYDISFNTYSDIYNFTETGGSPFGSLTLSKNGKLYGMTNAGSIGADTVGNVFDFDPSSNSFAYLHNFNGTDGSYPFGDLLETPLNLGLPLNANNTLRIYPNPSNTVLIIQYAGLNAQLLITDIIGNLVYQQNLSANISLDVSKWSKGIYFVKVRADKKEFEQKIVVQ